MSQRIGDFLTF